MSLEKVTITGADDSTPIDDLLSLSKEFPFVEWGILVSAKSEGHYRFPSRKWIDALVKQANYRVRELNPLNLSTHVCGRWVRCLFVGALDWSELPSVISISQRIQINTHAEEHVSTLGLLSNLSSLTLPQRQFIFQWDGVNDHFIYAPLAKQFDVAALYDTSGGAGRLPSTWPSPQVDFPCGYAGGLGPDNVEGQLAIIEHRCAGRDYWIDMERRVRTDDDSRLDLDKVRRVLEICKQHRVNTIGASIREEINRG
jgi:Phosphoribosylanthranilate isomerase